ncbi:MAG: ATP-binding cassette domain-containing protein [Candidatus Altiarchaeales archaeon]|nr:ATP-binding cassette domain-containing protein [Candidatus Altiarchaeales archaeon]
MSEDNKCDGKPLIVLEDVWKIYKMGEVEVPAVQGLSFKVMPCEFISIMGPSGSGKSTCMNMVGCLDIPTKGRIQLEGRDISSMNESDLAQIRGKVIGFVFQQFNLMPNLTALENVKLPMIFQDIDPMDRDERAYDLLKQVGLAKRVDHKPKEMSGGEQQRVAIARSLANDPDVILADEPTGNLDTKTGEEIMGLLSELHTQGKTIVMVTHDTKLESYVERVIRLRDGKIMENGE